MTSVREFDPNAGPWRDDPHGALAEFRQEQPVFRCPAEEAWVVTRYDDVAAVLFDGDRSTGSPPTGTPT
jgi:cytochrome P450